MYVCVAVAVRKRVRSGSGGLGTLSTKRLVRASTSNIAEYRRSATSSLEDCAFHLNRIHSKKNFRGCWTNPHSSERSERVYGSEATLDYLHSMQKGG